MKQLPEEDRCGTRKFTSHSHKQAEQQPEEDHCAASEAEPELDSLRELVCERARLVALSPVAVPSVAEVLAALAHKMVVVVVQQPEQDHLDGGGGGA